MMTRRAVLVLLSYAIVAGGAVSASEDAPVAKNHSREIERMAADLGFVLNFDEPPKAERITRPVYPRQALQACVEGTVVVLIGINAEGSVTASKVVESRDGLDEAALACTKDWRFKPARKGGVAVGTVAQAPVTFKIYDKDKGPRRCPASPAGTKEDAVQEQE